MQALPGATALQMCIFAGYQRAGIWGGVLAGIGFMLPAFAIMLVLAAMHSAYGALPFMRDAFYGISPVVLGIFIAAVWRLGRNAIKDRFSVLMAAGAVAALALSPLGPAGIFLLAGCIGVAVHHSRGVGLTAALVVASLIAAERFAESILPALSAGSAASAGLWDIGVFFSKVGALTFGGGLTIIAFIQDQVVNQLHWITAEQFLDALAIGQVTPGPVIMLAAFVGYKVRIRRCDSRGSRDLLAVISFHVFNSSHARPRALACMDARRHAGNQSRGCRRNRPDGAAVDAARRSRRVYGSASRPHRGWAVAMAVAGAADGCRWWGAGNSCALALRDALT